jgi:N-acetylmuramoyl-L-alanine amidase
LHEDKLLKKMILGSFVFLGLCILFSNYFQRTQGAQNNLVKALATLSLEELKLSQEMAQTMTPIPASPVTGIFAALVEPDAIDPLPPVWDEISGAKNASLPRQLKDRDVIVLEKKKDCKNATIWLEELPATRQLRVTIRGLFGTPYSDDQVERIAKDTYYYGTPPTSTPTPTPTPTPLGGKVIPPTISPTPTPISPSDPYYPWRNDVVKAIETNVETALDGSFTQSFLFTLNKTYVYELYEDEWNYYIALIRPKEVYKKIVVVDAGHGGVDEGTIIAGREHMEKELNLDIVLRLKELLDTQEDIKVYYTRTTDWKPSLHQRVDLANDVEADFFLSVHCNSNDTRSLHGTEVLYDSRWDGAEGMTSGRFAQILSEEMEEWVGLFNRGLVPREHNLTIIKYAEVPVALVEVGFLSNSSDLQRLIQSETRQNIAQALYHALLRSYGELEAQTNSGDNEMKEE